MSTTFHLLLAHALVESLDDEPDRNRDELLVWRPFQRTSPIVLDSLDPYQQLVAPDTWAAVHLLEGVAWSYDMNRLGGTTRPDQVVRCVQGLRRAEHELVHIVDGLRPGDEVVVTNPTAGAIDRYVALAARAHGARVSFLEDGVGAYLGASLKHAIDERYWKSQTSTKLAGTMGSLWRSALLHVARVNTAAVDLSSFDFMVDFVFDDVHVLWEAPVNVRHRGQRRPIPLEAARACLGTCSTRIQAQRSAPRYEALYLSRPDSEDGLLDLGEEIELTTGVLRRLAVTHRGGLAIKPHPRDRAEKVRAISAASGVPLIDDPLRALPAEIVINMTRAEVCYGTWSGSLLYGSVLLRTTAMSVLPAMLASMTNANRRLAVIWEQLQPLFAPHVDVWEPHES